MLPSRKGLRPEPAKSSVIVPISAAIDKLLVGAKAHNLFRALEGGACVLPGFVLTTAGVDALVRGRQVGTSPDEQLARSVEEQLLQAVTDLRVPRVAVRSSCPNEDGELWSYAGVFDSVLGVSTQNKDRLLAAVRKVHESLQGPRVEKYSKMVGRLPPQRMAVLVQPMVQGDWSGIAFTHTPEEGLLLVEYSPGPASSVVAGTATTHRWVIDVENSAVVEGDRTEWSRREYNALVSELRRIVRSCSPPQDVEWTVKDGVCHILQTRPQTARATRRTVSAVEQLGGESVDNLAGVVARAPRSLPLPDGPYILVVDEPRPQYLPLLERATAVVAPQGGVLTHFAILCRELNIPFFVLANALREFREGVHLELSVIDGPIPHITDYRTEITLMSFEPPMRSTCQREAIKKSVGGLPRLLGVDWALPVDVREDGVHIAAAVRRSLVAKVLNELSTVERRLSHIVQSKYQQVFALLGPLLAEPLFHELSRRTGSVQKSLSLLRGVAPLYLGLSHCSSRRRQAPFLRRFGVQAGDDLTLPEGVEEKRRRVEGGETTFVGEPAALVARVLRWLGILYEQKNSENRRCSP